MRSIDVALKRQRLYQDTEKTRILVTLDSDSHFALLEERIARATRGLEGVHVEKRTELSAFITLTRAQRRIFRRRMHEHGLKLMA